MLSEWELENLGLDDSELPELKARYKRIGRLRARDCPYGKANARKILRQLIEFLERKTEMKRVRKIDK